MEAAGLVHRDRWVGVPSISVCTVPLVNTGTPLRSEFHSPHSVACVPHAPTPVAQVSFLCLILLRMTLCANDLLKLYPLRPVPFQ